jgi:hypothetical protein
MHVRQGLQPGRGRADVIDAAITDLRATLPAPAG